MEAREHAIKASVLLEGIDRLSDKLENLSEDERLQMTVTGGFKRTNMDLDWSCRLALAHALTAHALTVTEEGVPA